MIKASEGSGGHVPVLLESSIAGLNLNRDGTYIDGTFGRGGHSRAILKELGPGGRLIAIDRDPQAIAEADTTLLEDPRFELVRGEFSEIKEYASERNLLGKVAGLLLDLGVSSPQLDEAGRGFSFRSDGPLDMRMDPTTGESAADWLNSAEQREIAKVLREFGEERQAGRIARAIVTARAATPICTTAQLAEIVAAAAPQRKKKRHPATKTFQALRIYLNDELRQLERALAASLEVLCSGGRLCVISFHSLEDRRVKRFIRSESLEAEPYRGLPEVPQEHQPLLRPIGKAQSATEADIAANPRARSARLRVAERT